MMYGNKYGKGVKPVMTAKAAGAHIVESKLNKGGDTAYRGKRVSVGRVKSGGKSGGKMKGMSY